MERFLKNILIFLSPVLLVACMIEMLLRNIPNDYTFKKEYLNNHASELETIILGNSHAYYGLDPEFFSSKTFNAAFVSQSLDFDYKLLKKYQNKLNNLKTVILPISYFTLFSSLGNSTESWRVKNYVIYYGIPTTRSIVDYFEILSNQPNVTFKRLAEYYFKDRSDVTFVSSSKLGWGTLYKSNEAKDLTETGKSAAERHTQMNIYSKQSQEIFSSNLKYLESILDVCQKKNVRVLLVTPSAFETYRKHINADQYKVTINTINRIARKYDNCTYLNLFEDTNFVAKDYYDADHLSEIGAQKLSRLINQKLNQQ